MSVEQGVISHVNITIIFKNGEAVHNLAVACFNLDSNLNCANAIDAMQSNKLFTVNGGSVRWDDSEVCYIEVTPIPNE
jgi:hypothetical protein